MRSDRRLLRRVLQNFLANALRYTRRPRGARHAPPRRRSRMQVWDTGPGIPEHHLRQIFDEFRRYEQPTTGASRAWASACRSASASRACSATGWARAAGRRQHVLDHAAARGVRATPPRERQGARAPDSLAGLRVLCVDNDPEILDGMRALLGRWQVEVLTAATVDEALQKIEGARSDAGRLPPARPAGWPGHPGRAARRQPRHAGALLTADGRDELKQWRASAATAC